MSFTIEIKSNTFYLTDTITGVEWKLPTESVRYEDNKDNSITYYDKYAIKASKNIDFNDVTGFGTFQDLIDFNDQNLGGSAIPVTDPQYKIVLNPNSSESQTLLKTTVPLATTKFVIETKLSFITGTWILQWGTLRIGVSGGNFVVGNNSGFDNYDLSNISKSDLIITYDVSTFDTTVSVDGVPLTLISTSGTKPAISSMGISAPTTLNTHQEINYLRLKDDTVLIADYDINDGSGLIITDSSGNGHDININVGTGDINDMWVQI